MIPMMVTNYCGSCHPRPGKDVFATTKHISLCAQPRGGTKVMRVTEADNFSYKGGGLKFVLALAASGSSTILSYRVWGLLYIRIGLCAYSFDVSWNMTCNYTNASCEFIDLSSMNLLIWARAWRRRHLHVVVADRYVELSLSISCTVIINTINSLRMPA